MARISIGTIAAALLIAAAGPGLASCGRAPPAPTPPNFKKEPAQENSGAARPVPDQARR